MKFSQLKPNPKNPRKITEEKLSQLEKSLKEFGSLDGFVYNRKTDRLIGGHQRQKIFKDAKITQGKVHWQGHEFPYREVNWSEEKEKAANIAANKGGGEWDKEILAEWFTELRDVNFDLDLTMFDSSELFFKEETNEGLCDADSVPKTRSTSIVRGGLFSLGNHRLLCGDSTSTQDVVRLMNGEKADMVFTDPPYGMNLDTDYSVLTGSRNSSTTNPKQGGKAYRNVQGDDCEFNPAHILSFFEYCKEIFMWGGDYYCDKLPLGTMIVWDKNNGNESADKMIGNAYEMCWSKAKHKKVMARIFGRGTFGHDKEKVHPTQKPAQLCEWFFEKWGKDAKLIVDLYLGSGTTLIACEKTNRKCYGMEIDPQYCQVIIDRWEKFTGKKAVKLSKNRHG